jgi:hypothetical protein
MNLIRIDRIALRRLLQAELAALVLSAVCARAETATPSAVQSLALRSGWNAISLAIDPIDPAPSAVFTSLPVDKVAAYFPMRTPVEFIQDPSSQPWKQKGWRAWFAPSLPEAIVSDLHAIQGGQCYLVHATAATTLRIQGTVVHHRTHWRADSFNLVGFPVDPARPPTFKAWFAGSSAHQSAARPLIYALDSSDRWKAIDRPESTLIQPGTAYWVFCQGASDYQGPLDVAIPFTVAGAGVDFGDVSGTATVRFGNATDVPIAVSAEFTPSDGLPVTFERKPPNSPVRQQLPLNPTASLGALEPGTSLELRLSLDRALMTTPSGAAVLIVRDDIGSMIRIPVTGRLP